VSVFLIKRKDKSGDEEVNVNKLCSWNESMADIHGPWQWDLRSPLPLSLSHPPCESINSHESYKELALLGLS
jgi:hypothetical protein